MENINQPPSSQENSEDKFTLLKLVSGDTIEEEKKTNLNDQQSPIAPITNNNNSYCLINNSDCINQQGSPESFQNPQNNEININSNNCINDINNINNNNVDMNNIQGEMLPQNDQNFINNNNNINIQSQPDNNNPNFNNPVHSIHVNQETESKMVGLINFNNNCYMNALLQCFSNIKDIKYNFTKPSNIELYHNESTKYSLSCVLARLIHHLNPQQGEKVENPFKPSTIYELIVHLNPSLKGTSIKDPIDLLIFLLDRLHKELNSKPPREKINWNTIDQTNNSLVFDAFKQNLISSNYSVIFNTFSWISKKERQCTTCNTKYYNYNEFYTLDLEIVEYVQDLKDKNQDYGHIKISDCLEFKRRKNIIPNVYCKICMGQRNFRQISIIYTSPNCLVFTLSNNREEKIKIIYENELDLSNYIRRTECPSHYSLVGIVVFYNEKYIALSKNPITEKWYYFNDDQVEEFNIENLFGCDTDYIPTILFYYKKK